MAEVAELFFIPFEEADDDDGRGVGDYPETLEVPAPFCLSDFFVPVFSPADGFPRRGRASGSDGDSESDSDYLDNPVSLTLDLFDRRPPPPPREIPDPFPETEVLDEVGCMSSDYLGLDMGHEDGGSGESPHVEGLRVIGFDSDSDSDDERIAAMGDGSDGGGGSAPELCWNCLCIEDDRRDPDEDFEWEEVDGRLDEREILSMMVGVDDESDGRGELHGDVPDLDEEQVVGGNVEWEVLLAGNLAMDPFLEPEEYAESYLGDDHGDFINTSEYEILFGQFADHESSLRGSPPAAKLVVENLPSVLLTEEDVAKNNTLCAVCKDEITLEDRVKQLPCLHHYHGDCILPWLGIRNTCPVCRYELLTDDPEYENWRAANAEPTEESLIRYDIEILR